MKNRPSSHSGFPRQAILLAAGLGTRLRPLTHRIPKPALPVGGIPIILYNLYLLQSSGIKNIVINLHHQPTAMQRLLAGANRLGMKLQWSLEKKILGTAGGIAKALRKLKPEPTFILNGDILLDLNLKKMHQRHRQLKAVATLAVVSPDRAKVESFVEYGANHKVYRIGGKPLWEKVPSHLNKGIFAGAHLVDPELFRWVPRNEFSCVIKDVYQKALSENANFVSYSHRGHWWDLGNLESLTSVDESLWNGTAPRSILQLWREVRAWSEPLLR
jgi:NDP-sugar pyrophosphorylase family protein